MKVHKKLIKAFGALLIAVMIFAALPAGEAKANDIPSATIVFESKPGYTLTDNLDGTFSGVIPCKVGGGFDIYAKEGAQAYFDDAAQLIGADHDAWGSWNPDTPDWYQYSLHLYVDSGTSEQKWALRNHPGATESDPWYEGTVSIAKGVPLSGTMHWGTMYAEETDVGAYLPGTGTAKYPGKAASHGGGSAYWDMDWSWGSEAVPLEYLGFEVSIDDLGSGDYRVTLTPAEGPVKNISTGATYGTIQGAIDAASAGDIIEVADGTYSEVNILIDKSLTLIGDPGDENPGPGANAPVLDGDSSYGDAFKIANGVSNVTIKGFEIQNYTTDDFNGVGNAVSAWVGSTSNITIQDNYLHDLGYNGVLVGNDYNSDPNKWGDHTGWTVKSNIIEDFGYIGFELTNTSTSTIEDNIIHMSTPYIGAVFSSARRSETGLTIKNNLIDGTPSTTSPVIYIYAYDCDMANPNLDDVLITGNTISTTGTPYQVYIWNIDTGTVTNVKVEDNKLSTLRNLTSETIDASPNWWGSITGPVEGQVVGDITYNPWCGDPGCTFLMPQDGKIVLDGTYNQAGGFEINEPNVTILIKDGTVIQNDSPCFIVNADNVTILGEYPGEEYCIPTDDSAGIEVAADVSNLVIKNLDFDGSNTTGSAIDFAGDVDGVQIVNNTFHDFIPSAIVFGGEVLTEHVIQGNMFMDVGTPAIDSGTTALDASFNGWGENAAPTITNVTTSPFTHANLWMESSGAFSGDQVAKGETITYTVYADMTEISGAEFILTYPTSLLTLSGTTDGTAFVGIPDDPSGTKDLLDTTTAGQIKFAGIVPLGNDPVTDTDVVLFTATFTAADPVPDPNTGVMDLVEISQGFSMTPDDPYYTNHVYPTKLLDGEVTVFERPTIDSTDIDGYYLVGDTQEFNVQTTNPADGGDFSNVLFKFEVQADDGDITLFQYDAGGTWYDMPLDCTTPGTCVGYFGPSGGFPLGPGYSATTTFQIQFDVDGTYPAEMTLVDVLAGDKVLTTFDTTVEDMNPVVYTKPTINSSDIGGPYTAEVEKCFSLTIDNVDADMILDGLVVTELSFDYPDGTVISYDGTDYTCTSGGCPLIPVTLTAGLNELEFCVTFTTEFDDDITVTLFDTDWDPDRELASKTFAVKVYANWSVEGKVTMQGRTYRGDIPMTLTGPGGFAFGPFTEDSLNQMGLNIFFTDIAEETYTITTDQDRYLNVMGYTLLIEADITLPDLYLYGGNANWDIDNVVDISDASIIGAQYGTGTIADNGDVNFDNRVNIQDLAIVGGNYGLDGAIAYASWLTP